MGGVPCPTSVRHKLTAHHQRVPSWHSWFPWKEKISRQSLSKDFFAGITGAIVVLPQGVAFAAIAGLPPEYGLYTAMIPVIVAALFGSSHHLVSGPTTPISLLVFSTLATMAPAGSSDYVSLALTLAFLAGLFQIALALAKLGLLVNFVSHSVVVGFTAGAAVLIASSQLKHLFGLHFEHDPWFVRNLMRLIGELPNTNIHAMAIGLITLSTVIALRWLAPTWPNMLLGMLVGSLTVWLTGLDSVAMVSPIPATLPPPSMPDLSPATLKQLAPGGLAIALMGLIEAVSIARSIGLHSGQKINGNREFLGQGLANLIGSFFSSYPSSGSFTRSGINFRSGAQTPMAAIFAAVCLTIIVLTMAPLAQYLPIASMAGVILVVAYQLIDFQTIRVIIRSGITEVSVFLVTVLATLSLELEFAIFVGVLLSLVIFLHRTAAPVVLSRVPDPQSAWRSFVTDPDLPECPQLKIIRIDGPLYFGSVAHIEEMIHRETSDGQRQPNLLIVCSGINYIDLPGIDMLLRIAVTYKMKDGSMFFFGVKDQVCEMFQRFGYVNIIGQNHIFESKMEAVQNIVTRFLNKQTCQQCNRKVFLECSELGNAQNLNNDRQDGDQK
ncbi:MAG: SulP family inorganic anion transporter [Magnetococcales bacterium]|nr:SulP family inorganic anion transporter [Magnetococcales bacterium]MBF0629655.1 SulP family inorganic anion transporter [Magnetococcales bacterium]